jgi:hypothetical protein
MEIFLSIVLWLLIGGATSYFANQRGRDPLVWFMLGMLLGFLGLLLLFILSPKIEQEKPLDPAEERVLKEREEAASPKLSHDYLIKNWYYYDTSRIQQGPVSFEALYAIWKEGGINQETFVWSEGMDGWRKIEEINNLYTHLQLTPP